VGSAFRHHCYPRGKCARLNLELHTDRKGEGWLKGVEVGVEGGGRGGVEEERGGGRRRGGGQIGVGWTRGVASSSG
jgi:hypothetical protein